MDVTLPNGVVVRGVPEGISKAQIQEMAIRNGMASIEDFGGASAPLEEPVVEVPEALKPREAPTKFSEGIAEEDDPFTNIQPAESKRVEGFSDMVGRMLSGGELKGDDVMSFWEADSNLAQGRGGAGKGHSTQSKIDDNISVTDVRSALEGSGVEDVDKAQRNHYIDQTKNAAQSSLLFTPVGSGVMGMAGAGALTMAADTGIEKLAGTAKGDKPEKGEYDLSDSQDMLLSAGIGGAAGAGFGVIGKGIGKLISHLKKDDTVTKETAKLAKKYGIELTPGQKVDGRLIKSVEDFTADGYGGGSILRTREKQVEKVKDIAEDRVLKSTDDFAATKVDSLPQVQRLKKSLDESTGADIKFTQDAYDRAVQEGTEKMMRPGMVDANIRNAVPDAIEEMSKKGWDDLEGLKDSKLLNALNKQEFGEDVWKTLREGPASDAKIKKFVKLIDEGSNPATVKKALSVKFSEDALVAGNKSGDFVVGDYLKFMKKNNSALKHFDSKQFKENEGWIKVLETVATGEKSTASLNSQGGLSALASRFGPAILGGMGGGMGGGMEGAIGGAAAGFGGRVAMSKMVLPLMAKEPFKLKNYLNQSSTEKLLRKLSKLQGKEADAVIDKVLKGLVIYMGE